MNQIEAAESAAKLLAGQKPPPEEQNTAKRVAAQPARDISNTSAASCSGAAEPLINWSQGFDHWGLND